MSDTNDDYGVPLDKLIDPNEDFDSDPIAEMDAKNRPDLPDGIGLSYKDIALLMAMKHKCVAEVDEPMLIMVSVCNAFLSETEKLHQAKMVDRLSGFARGAAKGVLTEWFEKNNPVARARNGRLVSVNVKGVPLPVSPNSWRIEWQETVRNHVGITVDTQQYEATMTVIIQPPRTDAEILRNPGGVYITELSFGTVLSTSEAARASSNEVNQ